MSSFTPTLDHLFMDSLQWVDQTYIQKHKSDDPKQLRAMYYPNLKMYSTHGEIEKRKKRSPMDAVILLATRYGKRAGISLTIYGLSFLPKVGHFVLPLASGYTFNKAVGPVPAAIVLGSGLLLPKRYMVTFLQTYFSSRSLMQQLVRSQPMLDASWLTLPSSNRTSHESTSPKSRKKYGSLIVVESSLVSRLHLPT